MRSESNFFSFLGLAARAGKCVYGAFACEKLVKSGRAKMIISDVSLSERSKHDIECMCSYYKIAHIEVGPPMRAGTACGKDGIMVIGITDNSFKNKLLELSKM